LNLPVTRESNHTNTEDIFENNSIEVAHESHDKKDASLPFCDCHDVEKTTDPEGDSTNLNSKERAIVDSGMVQESHDIVPVDTVHDNHKSQHVGEK
jgi:hypothetical protein